MERILKHEIDGDEAHPVTLTTRISYGEISSQNIQGYDVVLTPEILRDIADDIERLTDNSGRDIKVNSYTKPKREIDYNADQ